jgi:excisionase family DNA binding protein
VASALTLTVPEAAAELGISDDLAGDMVRAGRLPHVRWGARILVPRRALDEWLLREALASVGQVPISAELLELVRDHVEAERADRERVVAELDHARRVS